MFVVVVCQNFDFVVVVIFITVHFVVVGCLWRCYSRCCVDVFCFSEKTFSETQKGIIVCLDFPFLIVVLALYFSTL